MMPAIDPEFCPKCGQGYFKCACAATDDRRYVGVDLVKTQRSRRSLAWLNSRQNWRAAILAQPDSEECE